MTTRDQTFRLAVRSFGPFESAVEKQWREFTQTFKTHLELEAAPFDLHPLHDTLFEKRGLVNGDWDAAFVSTDWLAEAAGTGSLADVTESLKTDPPEGYPEAWPTSLLRMQSIKGEVLGLPYHDGPECLIYRTDLLQTAVEVPPTWDEFRATARRLNRPAGDLYGSVFAAYPDGHNTVYDFCLQLWSRGGELFTPDGSIQLVTPQTAEALAFYRSIVKDVSAVHPACRDFDSVKSGLAFARGEVTMMVNWFGFAAMGETISDSKVKRRVGVSRIPCQGGPHTSLNSYWLLGIGAGGKHKEIAWSFLKHCASAPMDKLLTLEGGIGCRKSTWNDSDVNRTIPFYRQLEQLHEDARELPQLPCWAELSQVIDRMVVRALDTEDSELELLRAAQSEADRLTAARV
jgi:multiple sugar transport system substrate-binding protein